MGEDALIRWIAASFLLLVGCATSPGTASALTVAEVWRDHVRLDGQLVRVQGVVLYCERLDCQLRESRGSRAKTLGIGTSEQFDREIQTWLGKKVVVEATLNAKCLHLAADSPEDRHGDELVVCADRSDELVNPKIVGHP